VIETLQPLPQDRKCFRLINGVLVERTVKDVLPALQTNSDGLKQVLDELVKQYKSKQDEMDNWKVWWTRGALCLFQSAGPSSFLRTAHDFSGQVLTCMCRKGTIFRSFKTLNLTLFGETPASEYTASCRKGAAVDASASAQEGFRWPPEPRWLLYVYGTPL